MLFRSAGNKENEKFTGIYAIDNQASDPARYPTRIEEALASLGFSPDDVDIMLDTHLHFDHAGGNTRRSADGAVELSFPRARYVVQRGELEWSRSSNERIRASYLPHNIEPVVDAGRMDTIDGEVEVVPGVRVMKTPGHTPHHQSVLISSAGETACFLADVIPTSAHLPLPWIMGYDVEPLVTLESKRTLLARARDEEWLLVFEHDPVVPWGRLDPGDKRPVLLPDS